MTERANSGTVGVEGSVWRWVDRAYDEKFALWCQRLEHVGAELPGDPVQRLCLLLGWR
jgi:hypothetical protein